MQINSTVTIGSVGVANFSKELSLEIAMDLTVTLLNAFNSSHPDLSKDDKYKIDVAASVIETHRKAGG